MDTILHYTDPTMTLVAVTAFVVTFVIGAWLGAKYGYRTILPAVALSAIGFYVRSNAFPLSIEAITAVSLLHVGAGALTALLVGKFSKPKA